MSTRSALHLAIVLSQRPMMARGVRKMPLPNGVDEVLRIAAGDRDALEAAAERSKMPAVALQNAAAFYIEQVLMHGRADSYRVLGCERTATEAELRQHVALLMRWLHPDVAQHQSAALLDRGVFVSRVTGAWNDLKTEERRRAYDSSLARRPAKAARPVPRPSSSAAARAGGGSAAPRASGTQLATRRTRPHADQPIRRLFAGVLDLLRRR